VGYEIGSEWREFRSLNLAYPALEEVTVYTDQDIPNSGWDGSNLNGQFMGGGPFSGALWLKKFNGNNIKRIGRDAFMYCLYLSDISFNSVETVGRSAFQRCESLTNVDLPSAIILEGNAFAYCTTLVSINIPLVTTVGSSCFNYNRHLTEIDLPLVTKLESNAFFACLRLKKVSFGGGFETETEIEFGIAVFSDYLDTLTPNINLFLSSFVLPKPNLNASTWQSNNWGASAPFPKIDYVWKSITVYSDIEENQEEKIKIFCIDRNIYYINDNISTLELYDIMGRKIKTFDNEKIIDLNDLQTGLYFLSYTKNYKIKIEKLTRH